MSWSDEPHVYPINGKSTVGELVEEWPEYMDYEIWADVSGVAEYDGYIYSSWQADVSDRDFWDEPVRYVDEPEKQIWLMRSEHDIEMERR